MVKRLRGNPSVARALNQTTVFDLLRTGRVISRVGLARETGLGKATISEIIEQFIAEGFVRVIGTGESRGGRRPVLLEFDPRARLAIGVELGDTTCSAVLTDLNAQPIRSLTTSVRALSAEEAIDAAASLVSELRSAVQGYSLIGLGVGTPGLVDSERGVIRMAPDLGWQEVPVGPRLADGFNLPVAVVNRAKAAALGEAWCGAGRQVDNLVYVSVSTGIAAGIVLDGRLYRGTSMSEGELGHVTVAPNGPLCRCGNRGCLQSLAGSEAILSRVREQIRDGQPTTLAANAESSLDLLTLQIVAEAAAANDPLALGVIEEVALHIGIAVAGLVNILNPRMLIFGGSVVRLLPTIVPAIEAEVRRRAMAVPAAALTVAPSQLGREAVPIGAAAYVLSQIPVVGSPHLRPMASNVIQPRYGPLPPTTVGHHTSTGEASPEVRR